jgi:hypothetical protein
VVKKMTVATVNAEFQRRGIPERLVRASGYFYFEGGAASEWHTSGVYGTRLGNDVEFWIKERNRLAGEDHE